MLRRLIRDGTGLRKRSDFSPETYRGRILRIGRRLLKRLRWTDDDSFCLDAAGEQPDRADTPIRCTLVLRFQGRGMREDPCRVGQI